MKISDIRTASKYRQTALLIDDQPTVLEIHSAILESLKINLKIIRMTDPIEALNWMKHKQVDLIITDFRMHQMNGLQFVQALKNTNPWVQHNIIIVTVISDKKIHKELMMAGAKACLIKPVQTKALAEIALTFLNENKHYFNSRAIG